MSKRPAMSRAVRTARGAFGALTATVLAAASHALAGGDVTAFAVVTTALFALPLCVLLAGRTGSLWRLALAVSAAQFVYHWSFSGLGIAGSASSAEPVPLHAMHLGAFAPALSGAGAGVAPGTGFAAADLWMWGAHALAALATHEARLATHASSLTAQLEASADALSEKVSAALAARPAR